MSNTKTKMFIKREIVKLRKKLRILKEERKNFYEITSRFANKISIRNNDIITYENRITHLLNQDGYNYA